MKNTASICRTAAFIGGMQPAQPGGL